MSPELLPLHSAISCPGSSHFCDCLKMGPAACQSRQKKSKPHVTVRTGTSWIRREAQFGLHDCNKTWCMWTSGGVGPADVFVESTPVFNALASERASLQQNYSSRVLVNLESCLKYPLFCNSTFLHLKGYTAVMSNQPLVQTNLPRYGISAAYMDLSAFNLTVVPFADKKNAVAALISNCDKEIRISIMQRLLQSGIKVDSYGKCFNNAAVKSHARQCLHLKRQSTYIDMEKLCIIRLYKFTLALENSIAPGYITEKLFQPLLVGSVPIYMGAPDVMTIVPHESSIISISETSDIKNLSLHIHKLMKSSTLYGQYLQWRTSVPSLGFRQSLRNGFHSLHCAVCDDVAFDKLSK